jgi:hypothetical protein
MDGRQTWCFCPRQTGIHHSVTPLRHTGSVTSTATDEGFAPAVLRGLVDLGPVAETDLALGLGLSAWMHFSDMDFEGARHELLAARRILLGVGNIDPLTEPIPFSGRSPRLDTLNLAAYLGNLIERAAASAKCPPDAIVERTIQQLPDVSRPSSSRFRGSRPSLRGRAG